MSIIIGADLVPTESNLDLFVSGNISSLIGFELEEKLKNASYRIFNMEVPLTDIEEPIIKRGPNLRAPSKAIVGYKKLGVDLVTLSNNHILDQGVKGAQDTISLLDNAGISYVGYGNDIKSAARPHIFECYGKCIGVYACAEHEFSVAGENTSGANPFDPLFSLDHIETLKKSVDFVIVLYHGGKELYRYPSPMLQRVCRRMIDKGADLIVCQHSHCIGCEERYRNRTIVYGQGNVLFDRCNDECWQTSLLIEIDDSFRISYIPITKCGNGVRIADEKSAKEIMNNFIIRSEQIKDGAFLQISYDDFAKRSLYYYLAQVKGKERIIFKIINKISNNKVRISSIKRKYDKDHIASLWNFIVCEAHSELFSRGLQLNINDPYENESDM